MCFDPYHLLTKGVSHPCEEPNPSQPTIRLEEDAYRDTYLSAVLSNLNAELIAEKHAFSELRGVSEARVCSIIMSK